MTLPWSVEITDGRLSNPAMLVVLEDPGGSASCRILRDGEEIAASSEMTGPLLSCPPAPLAG